ncbi:fungal zn(2)-Cys(6) binuclear cluster domain-containing protein [Hirsutella rhossiliensis]|uniref:Fungal zn(2)-Cys(6) binuclear cluster domain-containing protein n=1 Tax=Hirsutella rhossiliensis TaxID=111463 RepID=A0A9P8MNH9_9HYPO|nr:fungal zn(2)-Cys(6) binuclear cluster domain-containing protein [Hirsutella rhossiliensis]KAH0957644.1 fungal zn(2)-Cys(6) binuclear cluster domain-containing protein [Hirsutella rhossiliensis]
MTSRFRPLLPAPSYREPRNPAVSTEPPKRRSAVPVACSACQKAKSKCNGDRPVCSRCDSKGLVCEYDIEPNQTRAASRREGEEQIRELYGHLQSRPWEEAIEILRRIRETSDPLEVARLVRAGDLLLSRPVRGDGSAAVAGPHEVTAPYPGSAVPCVASSWTAIADRDTVRSLVDIFFERDQWFLMPFIDRDVFLRDMQEPPERPQHRPFCSALLVNAICALAAGHGAMSTERDRSSGSGLGDSFFTEAKRLVNFENGRPSIPAVQALLIMFSYSCRMGRDRVGNIFRASGQARLLSGNEKVDTSISRLAQLYQGLQELTSSYPEEDGYEGMHEREHCHLWAYHHLVAAHITRLIRRVKAHPLPWESPTDICIRHCQGIIKHVQRHFARYPSDRQGSLAALYFAYTCTIMLIDLLDGNSPAVVETFSRSCQIIHEATDFPLSGLLLEGLAAVANHMGVQLPPDVAPFLDDIEVVRPKLEGAPLGFVVPFRGRTLVDDEMWFWDTETAGIELGDLLGLHRRSGTA